MAMTTSVVLVLDSSIVIPVPVTYKVHLSFVVRGNPSSSCIRGVSPVAVVPPVTLLFDIPITIHPNVLGAGAWPHHANDARTRGWTNPDSNRDLSAECR